LCCAATRTLIEQALEMEVENSGAFSPLDVIDARRKIMASIVQRRGQRTFRESLMKAYDGRCAISGCPVPQILEAAHIFPYRGDATNDVTNGLLLRSDLHTLFDCGLIAVDERTQRCWLRRCWLAPSTRSSEGQNSGHQQAYRLVHPQRRFVSIGKRLAFKRAVNDGQARKRLTLHLICFRSTTLAA
jgi:hypothetical protein